MRFRTLALATLPFLVAVIPLAAHAASIPFFGPIIPSEAFSSIGNTATCPLSWGGLSIVINNIVSFLVTMAIMFVAPLSIGYAGFLMVVNPTSMGNIQKGKSIIINTIAGIVVALSAWLIVGAVMGVLYNGRAGAWDNIIKGGNIDPCLNVAATLSSSPSNAGIQTKQATSTTPPDGRFTYQAGIEAQLGTASSALTGLLTCMANKVPGDVGEISSISDSVIVGGIKTFQQCAAGGKDVGCSHTNNSCHYGGVSCVGESYAVDFGDEQHTTILTQAAQDCGATYTGFEGDHLHVGIGASCGCN